MNEQDKKARLIVKRIVAHIASEPDVVLNAVWEKCTSEVRLAHVNAWTKVATEVLGEKTEVSPVEQLRFVLRELGSREVMERAAQFGLDHAGASACTIGPSLAHLIACECEEPSECEWCCGTTLVTHRVKQAKDEHEHIEVRKEPESKTSEEFGDPETWTKFLSHSDWTDNFIHRMRKLGAVKIEVPASRSGSFSVEFEQGKQTVTSDPLGKIKQQILARRTDADDSKEEQPTLCAPCWSCRGPVHFNGVFSVKCPKCRMWNVWDGTAATDPRASREVEPTPDPEDGVKEG